MAETGSGAPATAVAREAVAVFHDWGSLQACVDDLLSSGFDRSELSLLAAQRAVEQKLGHVYEKVAELEDDPEVPRTAFVGRDSHIEARTGVIGALAYVGAAAAIGAVVASGGTFAAAIAAAAVAGGSGGLLGTIATRWLGRDRAKEIQTQIDKGGLLLWVHARDRAHEERAVAVLNRHSADDVHVHDLTSRRPIRSRGSSRTPSCRERRSEGSARAASGAARRPLPRRRLGRGLTRMRRLGGALPSGGGRAAHRLETAPCLERLENAPGSFQIFVTPSRAADTVGQS